ncbi:MAG: glycosyltransferase family 2 protein [Paludibacter sp.]|nr:glycosyltransferase family 2 protein [Paludibacter sp.]
MNKKISVIIPIYNAEKYLKQTLDSVRFQTYKNLEIICILDCPTDNSEKIANEIAKEDSRVKIIYNVKNIGAGETRNIGISKATGDYIHFMDSDDLLSPDFYEILINAAVENDADIAASSVFNEKQPKQSILFSKNEVLFGKDKIKKTKVLLRGWIWRYLIKKSFWQNNNFIFPNLAVMEDIAVAIPVIFYANKVALCSDAMYFYKNRENSILNTQIYNPEQKKLRFEQVRKVKNEIKNFLKINKIKNPNWFYLRFVSLRTRKTVCTNDTIEYGKTNKKISVIIPIYNAEKYLKQTLDYVRFQTYRNLEIICVLDCPTDNSAEIVKKIAKEDDRIKIVEHSKNSGLPTARHSGVENSTGEYFHFMDSDDFLNPDFYEIMISASEKTNADVSACSVFYEKKPLKSIWFEKSEVLTENIDKIRKTEVAMRGWAWRYLIKKDFWTKHKFYFPELVPMEDMPVMIPMIYCADKVVLCPNAVYFYKNRENSILNKKHDPDREKQRSENRHKARKIFKDFLRANNIKRPNKLLYDIKKYI